MELGLQEKVALVTGGSEGIGFATARRLALEGARVAILSRSREKLERAAAAIERESGLEPLLIAGDASRAETAGAAVEQVAAHFGRLHILVNNAGTAAAGPFAQVEDNLWQQDLDLKLLGAVRFARAAIPHLRAAGGGAIVNVTAIGGKAPGALSMPSSVSRAAGLAMTKALSQECGPFGIRVNAVCIGLIRSEQIENGWRRTAPHLSWEEYSRDRSRGIPLGRIGESDEAANVIAFLASDAASYVTGVAVNIDGGTSPVL
jgi:3-oxoacyl-[acyl-carrier protein] reductase